MQLKLKAQKFKHWMRERKAVRRSRGRRLDDGGCLPLTNTFIAHHVNILKEQGTTVLPGFVDAKLLADYKEHFENQINDINALNFPITDVSQRQSIDDTQNDRRVNREDYTSYKEMIKTVLPRYLQIKVTNGKNMLTMSDIDWQMMEATCLHEKVLSIMAHTMGIYPYYNNGWTRRSQPLPVPVDNLSYHRDWNDYKYLLKVFVYLTDVTLKTGAHCYMKGTFKKFYSWQNKKTRFTDEEIYSNIGKEHEVILEAPAGTVIIEDTRGYHKGMLVQERHRDMSAYMFTGSPESQPDGVTFPKHLSALQQRVLKY